MPFDALVTSSDTIVKVPPIDELEAIGITPIPDAIIETYKARRVRRWGGWWHEIVITNDFLERLGRLDYYNPLPRRASAPPVVVRLAMDVRDAVPNAVFRVVYHLSDPYLRVLYGTKLSHPWRAKSAYLALWRNRRLLTAIAQREGDPSLRALRLRTFFG